MRFTRFGITLTAAAIAASALSGCSKVTELRDVASDAAEKVVSSGTEKITEAGAKSRESDAFLRNASPSESPRPATAERPSSAPASADPKHVVADRQPAKGDQVAAKRSSEAEPEKKPAKKAASNGKKKS